MGRKGIGKLAPFGICRFIEVIASGGDEVERPGSSGETEKGYLTAHIILDKDEIISDTDDAYPPEIGELDGSLQPKQGTTVILRDFDYRLVSKTDVLSRQLAQRFGVSSTNWLVRLRDTTKTADSAEYELTVGDIDIPLMSGTKIEFVGPTDHDGLVRTDEKGFKVKKPDGTTSTDYSAGFFHGDRFFPVTGWVAYSKNPYKDDYLAGVRIYCRKKIATRTLVFNMSAGFHGEHSVRSYLVGVLHAEWLDEEEDMILTDRRDILWSHELAEEFEKWGQEIIKTIGRLARNPMRQRTWEKFIEVSHVIERVKRAFPGESQQDIRQRGSDIAKLLGQTIRPGEVEDPDVYEPLVQLTLMLAPHMSLDEQLRAAAEEGETSLDVINTILKTARLAELSSFGRIAEKRVKVIERLTTLKDDDDTKERDLQRLIERAPWLVNAQWTPITANRSLRNLQRELPKYFKKKHKIDITIGAFENPDKQPDFVLSSHDGVLQVIEIKRPHYKFGNDDFDRMFNYIHAMEAFFADDANKNLREEFHGFHITLVSDEIKLDPKNDALFKQYTDNSTITRINWLNFLQRTQREHEDFLAEAERQQQKIGEDEDG